MPAPINVSANPASAANAASSPNAHFGDVSLGLNTGRARIPVSNSTRRQWGWIAAALGAGALFVWWKKR